MGKLQGHDLFRYAALIGLGLTYVTILLGGNVMASGAGLGCPKWPSCDGTFTPALTGAAGIEWAHRLSALVLSVAILGLTILGVLFERRRPVLLRLSLAALTTVVGQALLGGLIIDSGLNATIVILHLGLATALFALLAVIVLLANFRKIPRRWLDWAQQSSTEVPPSDAPTTVRTPGPLDRPNRARNGVAPIPSPSRPS
jgi:heme A synthase